MDMNSLNLANDYLTMMSAPDHANLSSPSHYVNSPVPTDAAYLCMSPSGQKDDSGIFSPRTQENHFDFPSPASDTEDAAAAELSPMLKSEEEHYLKPIDVHQRRAEFARQREAIRNQTMEPPVDRDSGYCNAPRNVLIDTKEKVEAQVEDTTDSGKDLAPAIISTQDNYVNMPKQKSDLRGMPNGFSNPSYQSLMVVNNQN